MRNSPTNSIQPSGLLMIGLTTFFLALLPSPAPAADPEVVEIRLRQGKLVLVPAQIEIKEGQSIKWVPIDHPNAEHDLRPKSPNDAFQLTGVFVGEKTQSFNKAGEINYFCFKHPSSMIGKINVTAGK